MGIENPSRMNVAIQVAQQPFQLKSFFRARFARDSDEALAGSDAVTKRRKRSVIAGVGKKNRGSGVILKGDSGNPKCSLYMVFTLAKRRSRAARIN